MRKPACVLLLLALALTLVNALKPLHIDDAAYAAYAAHIAEHPLAPYDFLIYWDNTYQPANRLLAPPVVPYFVAGALSCLGDDPVLWKLALLPFHLILVVSLYLLLLRFAPIYPLTLVALIVLSPALLPATNLMLDVPALALGLAAVVILINAADRRSWKETIIAGLLAGLAMQTKYTGAVVPAVFLAYGVTHRSWREPVVAAFVAAGCFVAWEAFVAHQHGDSHFVLALANRQGSIAVRATRLINALGTMTAGVAPGTLLLALYAVTRSMRLLAVAALLLVGGALLMGLLPETAQVWTRGPNGQARLGLESAGYGLIAIAFWVCLGVVICHLLRHGAQAQSPDTVFLVLWLALEIAAYFALSPFPAARRVLGIVVVATLLTARLAAAQSASRGPVLVATLASAFLAILVSAVDFQEALATRRAAAQTAAVLQANPEHGRTWFSSYWGYTFYALREGMVPIESGRVTLRAGDLLILVEQPISRLDFEPAKAPLAVLAVIEEEDLLPWRTVACYYAGRTPLQHHVGPRLRITIYRVLADFVPTAQGVAPPLHGLWIPARFRRETGTS